MSSEDEENASEGRKQYLRENRDNVHWLHEPPSWWNEEEDGDEEDGDEEEWREAALEMLTPEQRAMNPTDAELLAMLMEHLPTEVLLGLSGL
jgi:hypothetical protein